MHLLLVFAVIIPSALADICCMPDQFSIRSKAGHSVTVDYKTKNAVYMTIGGLETIYNLADKKVYSFLPPPINSCISTQLKPFFFYKQCIPDDAIKVKVDGARHSVYRYNVTANAQVEMTIGCKCRPVRTVDLNSQTPLIMQWMGFSKKKIDDSVFYRNYAVCEVS